MGEGVIVAPTKPETRLDVKFGHFRKEPMGREARAGDSALRYHLLPAWLRDIVPPFFEACFCVILFAIMRV
ncbi:MAG: hypothetical protein C4519_27305 [Desulfobacteraceae bacterium]|nr:MAG: hypothetical protein C4519_27305 [Desulfobacteraceae bacterium]